MKILPILLLICTSFFAQAQYFSHPSYGEFDTLQMAQIMYVNGTKESATIVTNKEKLEMYEDNGYVFTKNGEDFFVEIDSIQTLQLWDITGQEIYMERMGLNHEDGNSISRKYQKETMLLQLANPKDSMYIKIYIDPGFDVGGSERFPVGTLDKDGFQEHKKEFKEEFEIPPYYGQSAYYFKTTEEEEAIRIEKKDYLEYAPIIFQGSSSFLKKYYLPKLESSKKFSSKKRSKKEVTSNNKPTVIKLFWNEIPEQLEIYKKLFEYDEERKAARRSN